MNLLVKIDEYKVPQTEAKAFFEDVIFVIRKFKNIGNLAIVGHSNILKAFIPIDNFFFERLKKGKKEKRKKGTIL